MLDRTKTLLVESDLPAQYGLFEFGRRLQHDSLSVVRPEMFERDIVHTRILFQHSFFLNQPEYIEQVLLTKHGNYAKSSLNRRVLGPALGNGLIVSEGEYWRRQRRIVAPAFHHKRIACLVETMVASANEMIARWQSRTAPFELAQEMRTVTLDIIARTMFSADVSTEIPTIGRLVDIILDTGRISLIDMIGLPEWLPRRRPRRLKQAIAELDAVVARVLAPRRADHSDRGDLLSMLLGARDPQTGEVMTDRQLRDEIVTIFLAGHETTANAVGWAWYLLACHPGAEAKLHEEVDRVLGGRAPRDSDLAELKYTRMVVEEAMRLYPPVPMISRTAIGEDSLGGVRIPRGAFFTISPYVTHRNPNLWPDPTRFDPERFSPEQVAKRHRFAYLPFGGGPRICIGNGFAMTEAQIIIATVAQQFRLRLLPEHVVEPIGLMTLRAKNGIWVTLERRKPLQ